MASPIPHRNHCSLLHERLISPYLPSPNNVIRPKPTYFQTPRSRRKSGLALYSCTCAASGRSTRSQPRGTRRTSAAERCAMARGLRRRPRRAGGRLRCAVVAGEVRAEGVGVLHARSLWMSLFLHERNGDGRDGDGEEWEMEWSGVRWSGGGMDGLGSEMWSESRQGINNRGRGREGRAKPRSAGRPQSAPPP